MTDDNETDTFRLSRRQLLLGAAAGSAAAMLPSDTVFAAPRAPSQDGGIIDLSRQYPYYGSGPQAGIQTPPQHYVVYMTFDLTTSQRRDLQTMLALWSAAIAQ